MMPVFMSSAFSYLVSAITSIKRINHRRHKCASPLLTIPSRTLVPLLVNAFGRAGKIAVLRQKDAERWQNSRESISQGSGLLALHAPFGAPRKVCRFARDCKHARP